MKLPRLPSKSVIIDGVGVASLQFQLWWQRVVEQIEEQFASINQLITDLAQAVADITAAQAAADAAQTTADGNTAAVASLDTRVDTAETDIGTLQTDVTALQGDVADHETRIVALESAGGGGYPPQLGYAGL